MRSSVGSVVTDTGRMVSSSGSSRIIMPGGGTTSSSSSSVPVLGEKGCGLLVTRTSTSYPAVVFYLAGARSKLKPTLQRQGSYQFLFRYPLVVPPKKTVAIVHGLAQRNLQGTPDAKTLAGYFKPFQSRTWTRDLPAEVRQVPIPDINAIHQDMPLGCFVDTVDQFHQGGFPGSGLSAGSPPTPRSLCR